MSLVNGQVLSQYDFSGGINISNPGHLIAANECYANASTYDGTRNCYWDVGVKKRLGTLKVNTYPGVDQIKDGDCEAATNPILKTETTALAVSNGTWARSAVQKHSGSYSWKLTKTTAGGAGDAIAYLCDSNSNSDLHELKANRTYYIEVYLWSDVASPSNVSLHFDEYYLAQWHTNAYSPSISPPPGQFVKVSGTLVTNAATAGILIYVKIASAEAANKLVYIDDIRIIDIASRIGNGYRFYRSGTPQKTTFVSADYLDETKILYLDANDNFQEVTGGSTISANQEVYFTKWKDTLYVASGDAVIQTITYSSGWVRSDITGNAAKPLRIIMHKDRLWAAGGDMVQGTLECTAYDDDTDWSGDNGELFNVGYKDGDPITALVPLGNDLIIYKNNSIWAMVGDNLYNWTQQKRETSMGCVAPKSAVDVGNGHIFLGADNIYFYDGTSIIPIGNKIKPWLDQIPPALRKNAAGVYFNNFYRLSFPSSLSVTLNDVELVLNLRTFKAGTINWWLMDGRNIASYIPCDGPQDDNTILITDDAEGSVRYIEYGPNDDGTNFIMEFHSRYEVFDQPNIEKMYDRVKLDTAMGIGNITMQIIRNLNDEYTFPKTLDVSALRATYGTAILDTTTFSSQSNSRMTFDIPLSSELDGYAISYKIIHTEDYENVVFYGFTISYALKVF